MAAVLACGDGAALSHFAAAELWTLLPSTAARPSAVDVSVPTRAGRRQRKGISGLPQPAVNAAVHGLTVDFLWRAERVVVETDGRGAHGAFS
jgi:hypothetical protein